MLHLPNVFAGGHKAKGNNSNIKELNRQQSDLDTPVYHTYKNKRYRLEILLLKGY